MYVWGTLAVSCNFSLNISPFKQGEIFLGHTSSGFLVVHGFGPGFRWDQLYPYNGTLMRQLTFPGSKDLASSFTPQNALTRWESHICTTRRCLNTFHLQYPFKSFFWECNWVLIPVLCWDWGRESRVDKGDSKDPWNSTASTGKHSRASRRAEFTNCFLRTTIWRCPSTRRGTTRLHFSTDDFNPEDWTRSVVTKKNWLQNRFWSWDHLNLIYPKTQNTSHTKNISGQAAAVVQQQ